MDAFELFNQQHENDDDDDISLYADKKELIDYMKHVIRLESIFRSLRSPPTFIIHPPSKHKQSRNTPWIISMRVVTPLLHPISQEEISVTTSNHTSSTPSSQEEKTQNHVNTLSLLANLPSHMSLSGTQIQQTIQQSLFRATTDGTIDKKMIPRLLFTCTNVTNELYEAELSFEDLMRHKSQMALEKLNWKTYLDQIHYGIFMYDTNAADEESVCAQYEDETRDLLKLTILAPLTSTSPVKLKYEFELCAVRSQAQFSERVQGIVYDQTVYSTQLYRKRIQEDQKTIQQLEKELKETRSRLLSTEDRLALFRSGTSDYTGGSMANNGDLTDEQQNNSTSANNNKNNKLKRKAPMSLINPAQKKRKAGITGAKIK